MRYRTTMLRTLILTALALGVARWCGFSLLDWLAPAVTALCTAASAVLAAAWKLLHPDAENPQHHLPDVHQAILNVTHDATRVADLLEDFFAQQYRDDPQLKDRFLAYMATQANTSYSVVDNQLSFILWLYSMIWMPLLIVMCFARASRSAQPSHSGGSRAAAANELSHSGSKRMRGQWDGASIPAANGRGLASAESMGDASQQRSLIAAAVGQRQSFAEQQSAGLLMRQASMDAGSARSASMRTLRRSASTAAGPQRMQLYASSDSLRSRQQQQQQQPLLFASVASLPSQLQVSESGTLKAPGRVAAGRAAQGFRPVPAAPIGDLHLADQSGSERGSAGGGMRSLHSLKARQQPAAAAAAMEHAYSWQLVS